MKRAPNKTKQPLRNPDSTMRPLDNTRLRDVRGGTWNDGGITAEDDWEKRN
jgi:hypothetical protein